MADDVKAGGERVSRDAIERTSKDWREQVQKNTGRDPGAAAAHQRVREAVLKSERNQRKER